MSLETIIKNYCEKNDLIYGITDGESLDFDSEILEGTPFVNFTFEERTNPQKTLSNVKSVIVLGVPYGKLGVNEYAVDYHIIVKKHLDNLCELISSGIEKDIEKEIDAKAFVDTGALFERGFALKSSIGFRGRNTSVINKEFGSYFNIGYILTNTKLEFTEIDESNKADCFGCNRCLDWCPTNSLGEVKGVYKCNFETCISYLTQKKGLLTLEEMLSMGESLYGCEICQQACPHNYEADDEENYSAINPIDILHMSKKDFEKFREFPFYWRGLLTLKRNALISIYNSKMLREEKLTVLSKYLNSENQVLSETAKILLENLNNIK